MLKIPLGLETTYQFCTENSCSKTKVFIINLFLVKILQPLDIDVNPYYLRIHNSDVAL